MPRGERSDLREQVWTLVQASARLSPALPPITINGVRYRVLKLEDSARGPRYLLRSDDGDLFGVYGWNAQAALSAAPLVLKLAVDNPFREVDFFETAEGGLLARS